MSENNPSHHGIDDFKGENHPQETIRLLLERSSCRSFHDKDIPDDILNTILRAAIHAATGGNLQPYSIIKIKNGDIKRKLVPLCGNQEFISTAPVDLLFCIDWHRLERWAKLQNAPFTANNSFRHFWISFQDTIIAAQNICTAADALGLGSVYVGTVLECFRELRDILELPDGVFPVVLLSLGYPKVRPASKKKLDIDIIVHDEKYRDLPDSQLLEAFENKYPDWKKEITEERLEIYEEVCRDIYGADAAAEYVAIIKRQGYFNAVQNYFGLHYMANLMPERNEDFLKIVEDFGFGWFKKHGRFGSNSKE
jgi:FMN reductase [NAD(P)H]